MVNRVGTAGAIQPKNKNKNNASVKKKMESARKPVTANATTTTEQRPFANNVDLLEDGNLTQLSESERGQASARAGPIGGKAKEPEKLSKYLVKHIGSTKYTQDINKALFEFGRSIMNATEPLLMSYVPSYPDNRPISNDVNFCVNPLQVIRAYGVLSHFALGKTSDDIQKYITEQMNAQWAKGKIDEMLFGLQCEIEEDVDGCVRLFADLQHHILPKTVIFKDVRDFYGDKSGRSVVQHLSFSSDPDGLYSIWRINQEMARSTNNAVQFVVPNSNAPNWRASIALASCSDNTFYLARNLNVSKTTVRFFFGPRNVAILPGHRISGSLKVSSGGNIICLPGLMNDFTLFVIKDGSLSNDVFEAIDNSQKWLSTQVDIDIPETIVSTPLSLADHAKSTGLSRVFNGDKSELFKLHPMASMAGSNYVSLWDHYHKSLFQIKYQKLPDVKFVREHNSITPERAQVVDDGNSVLYPQRKARLQQPLINGEPAPDKVDHFFAYYEKHLGDQSDTIRLVDAENQPSSTQKGSTYVFDKPYSFVVTRKSNDTNLILCMGKFNNVPCVLE